MKNNLLKNVLDWVLLTSVLLTVYFFVQFFFRTKELRTLNTTLQLEMQKYQNNHGILNLLINDTVEYSKTHPDANLARILESVKPAPGPATAAKP
jgi:uncharacterized membrane protein